MKQPGFHGSSIHTPRRETSPGRHSLQPSGSTTAARMTQECGCVQNLFWALDFGGLLLLVDSGDP